MRRDILMPLVSPDAKGGKIARWHVSEGQAVEAGDVLADIVTATATLEIEATNQGRVEKILVPAGTAGVMVNTPIAIIRAEETKADTVQTRETRKLARLPAREVGTTGKEAGPEPAAGPVQSLSYREALRDALTEEMRRDADVFLIGVDVAQNRGAQKVSQGLLDEFGPERVITAPPLEDAFTGLAIGAALSGLKPVVEFTSFSVALEACHQILGTAAETHYVSGRAMTVPIVFRGPNGWSPGLSGIQSRCFASLFAQVPGLKVVAPAFPSDAKGLLKAAIRDSGPVVLLEHEMLYGLEDAVPVSADWIVPIGKARIARAGRDISIVAYGRAVLAALEAAEELSREGMDAEVIDLRSLRPLDLETVAASVTKTRRLLTVEDGWPTGSIGSGICAAIAASHFGRIEAPPAALAGCDVPMPYAEALEDLALPSAKSIARAAKAALGRTI
jgi:pyruvate dehydrogenase E1 component beta subunit